MQIRLFFICISFLAISSCKSVFKVSPYTSYKNKLQETGLSETKMGRDWITRGESAVNHPSKEIMTPYNEAIYFRSDEADALGVFINYSPARKIRFKVNTVSQDSFAVFIDLLERGEKPKNIISIQSADTVFYFEDKESKQLVLRLQPELLISGKVNLEVIDEPKLGFPVQGAGNRDVKSFWGMDRDGGARKHEGIDIFAKRGTPVVAVEDGMITRVQETNLGGKVVWQRLGLFGQSIYYAHLDSQLVDAGQEVKKGEPVGLVGNTGNARLTSPHLHFGIYTASGAIDPLDYVKITDTILPRLRPEVKYLGEEMIIRRGVESTVPIYVLSVSSTGVTFKNEFNEVEYATSLPLSTKRQSAKLSSTQELLASPMDEASPIGVFNPEKTYTVLAKTGSFVYVNQENLKGW
ncbi:M23 family metallopeptidase, partial [Pseudoxanthomonas sp. SGD-10]